MSVSAMTEVLGLGAAGLESLALVSAIEKGLPVSALDRLSEAISPDDETFKYRIVPRPTLTRRRKDPSHRLTTEESGRLARLAKVWAFAVEVWGEEAQARSFLSRSHPMLDGRKPLELVLANDFGADVVENILGGLKYGIAV